MKEGVNVTGLNTAATLWCSAAVGAAAGAGLIAESALLTVFVLAGNTLLRPLVNGINRIPLDERTTEATYKVRITASPESAGSVREALADALEHDYAREVPGFGFPTLREQVIHIFNCEGFWIHALKGQALQGLPYGDRNPAGCASVADARQLQREVGEQTLAYLAGLTDQQISSNTELRYPDGDVAVRIQRS